MSYAPQPRNISHEELERLRELEAFDLDGLEGNPGLNALTNLPLIYATRPLPLSVS
jgi:hypothetical protein